MRDNLYWIKLSLSVTAGLETFRKLIEKFKDAYSIFNADPDDISACIGSKSRDYAALCDKNLEESERILNFCEKKNVGILTYNDERFPNELRKIPNPPAMLYYRGVLPDFTDKCLITMVGTRRLTDYGRKNAFKIGYDLAKSGAVIVSGMAIGIDGVSHAGSLSANGINIAFLGSGIDVCYPEAHKILAREIVKTGCIFTEYPPGTRPNGYNFPRRNRLIAGISSATVVIEGRENSGAIITARLAKEQGKKVYALPGNVDNKTSEVTNLLIRNGASLITCADDIIGDLSLISRGRLNPFNLDRKPDVRLEDAVAKYCVSCVTPSDSIFTPSKAHGERKKSDRIKSKEDEENNNTEQQYTDTEGQSFDFDHETLRIYKKIPFGKTVPIESLTDEVDDSRTVMKALLRLEMGRFVVMLPGENVKRNI